MLSAWQEVLVGFFQILERVLQRVNRRIFEPGCLGAIAPRGQIPGHCHIANERVAGLVIVLLQCQRLVEYEATSARVAAHIVLLFAGRL